jgi:hypothetical protein
MAKPNSTPNADSASTSLAALHLQNRKGVAKRVLGQKMKLKHIILTVLAGLTIATTARGHGSGYWNPMLQTPILSATAPGEAGADERSKKDWWDKLDIIAKAIIALFTALAAVVIPVVVAIIGRNVQRIITAQTTGKDYIQIALSILQNPPQDSTIRERFKNKDLRKWAVSLLNKTSPVPFDKPTAEQLIHGQTQLPLVTCLLNNSDISTSSFWDILMSDQPTKLL